MEPRSNQTYLDRIREIRKDKAKRKKFNIIVGSIIVLFFGFIGYIWYGLPSLEELENPKPQLASKVYSIDGELIGQFYIENRIETDIDSLPCTLR